MKLKYFETSNDYLTNIMAEYFDNTLKTARNESYILLLSIMNLIDERFHTIPFDKENVNI